MRKGIKRANFVHTLSEGFIVEPKFAKIGLALLNGAIVVSMKFSKKGSKEAFQKVVSGDLKSFLRTFRQVVNVAMGLQGISMM